MYITRLRLIGFKSFVEPTELLIENGLTGVVGPNGCGKSNLLEALRWVMGETSYKSMRASAMNDVIFSGTNDRPARNMAEVTISIDNSARRAPAEFNDNDHIEITRRIERDAGSVYRINNREIRARDIKILFEDAATGARSPALVRQGQIGEIVNAKPEQRRRILEDAAGTAGLHSRRHDAELRLRGAEANLARISDIIGHLNSQIEGLKRQARQARRYSELSEKIRKAEALQCYLTWLAQQRQVDHDEAALQVTLEGLGKATLEESKAIKQEAELAETLQPLRDEETTRAAILARLQHAQSAIESELQSAQKRLHALETYKKQLEEDIQRERDLLEEAYQHCQRLESEQQELETQNCDESTGSEDQLKRDLQKSEIELTKRDKIAADLMKQQSEMQAQRRGLEGGLKERIAQRNRLTVEKNQLLREINKVTSAAPDTNKLSTTQKKLTALKAKIASLDDQAIQAGKRAVCALEKLQQTEIMREAANIELRELETEHKTLAKLFQETKKYAPAIADQVVVTKGYEMALGAALGDDLELPIAVDEAVHWRQNNGEVISSKSSFAAMPAGIEPLTSYVSGPPELARRLAYIGLVEANKGPKKQGQLLPGQRIVSREGDLWRWDGLVAPAGSPSPATQRLAARNRLKELIDREAKARDTAAAAQTDATSARTRAQAIQQEERDFSQKRRDYQGQLSALNKTFDGLERAARENEVKLNALYDRKTRLSELILEADKTISEAEAKIQLLPPENSLASDVQQARLAAIEQRDAVAAFKAKLASLALERERRIEQAKRLAKDLTRWRARAQKGKAQIAALGQRLNETNNELKELTAFPKTVEEKQQKLFNELSQAETERRLAANKLNEAEIGIKEVTQSLRIAQKAVTEQREIRARAEVRLEAARERRAEIVKLIEEKFATTPEQTLDLAEHDTNQPLPQSQEAETRLARLKIDRDRLGGVNLQAGEELASLNDQYKTLAGERADIEQAIVKLRAGITNLNREGRKRLKEAFNVVDGHFQNLFTTLFGGGEAKLEMIDDGDDPLAGGLEIIARPPGKKPTTLSLLSGGEQTLTALSLIFAVFLTNPSPICVLDEVDAPLDDANVDRFCTLMEKMAANTDTRFLVITHHPMTMARMDRLFGVTMVERGVSQLVSVDLAAAENILDTG